MTVPRFRGVAVVLRKVSITYRGSAYEQSWETCFFATVASPFCCGAGRLRQSATTAATCATTTVGAYLRNDRKHRCAGRRTSRRASDPYDHVDPLHYSVTGAVARPAARCCWRLTGSGVQTSSTFTQRASCAALRTAVARRSTSQACSKSVPPSALPAKAITRLCTSSVFNSLYPS